jgi:hypothetical protein
METLRNCGIEFVCVSYIERTSVGNVLLLFKFCSAHVSALLIALSDIPCERIRKCESCLILKCV